MANAGGTLLKADFVCVLDYRETATRLQKEWNLENPQQLPFAPHVTNHALVSVLNKGLLYNACERESATVS